MNQSHVKTVGLIGMGLCLILFIVVVKLFIVVNNRPTQASGGKINTYEGRIKSVGTVITIYLTDKEEMFRQQGQLRIEVLAPDGQVLEAK